MDIGAMLAHLFEAAGQGWCIATGAAFIATLCEAANPDEEYGVKRGAIQTLGAIASLITPFLLFVHAFWAVSFQEVTGVDEPFMALVLTAVRQGLVVGVLLVMIILMLGPQIPGWIVRKTAPGAGRVLHRVAPWLHLAVLALVVFVTRDNVMATFIRLLDRA